ncbi:MAG TPA: DUF4097 family beta strand repeat-containing protein [Vicinamibacterales bacterium]|nr:DUF4097 family beta strand repeat-containing protein [Vicinamibacterales bacterium]
MTIHQAHSGVRFAAVAVLIAALGGGSACQISFGGVEGRDSWAKQYTLAAGGKFELTNTNGRIRIEASPDGNTVDVRAEKIAKANDEAAAQAAAKKIEIRESASADRVSIDSAISGLGLSTGERRVDYVITVPHWAQVTVDATNGDIDIRGVTGFVDVDATNGRIQASGMEHGAKVEATNGAVTLEFAKVANGDIRCDTTNGAIYVTVPKDAKMRVSASVSNGAIQTHDLELTVAEQSRRRLDATANGGGASVRLETTNGLISLKGR